MGNAELRTEKNKGGFTLIEIVITLVVLSIAALGVLSVFTVGISRSTDPLILNQATQLAQEKMDSIVGDRQALGFSAITTAAYPAEAAVTGFPNYSRSVNVICVAPADLNADAGCPQNYKQVTVTVSWNAGAETVAVTGLFANF